MFKQYLVKLKQYIGYFYRQENTRSRFQKRMLCGILFVFSFIMVLYSLFVQEYLYAAGMAVYFLIVFVSWLLLNKQANEALATRLMKPFSFLLVLFVLLFGSDNLATLLWLGVIPSLSMMYLQFRSAVSFLLGTLLLIVVLYVTPVAAWLGLAFHPYFTQWSFLSFYVVFAMISGVLELMRHMTDAQLEESRQEILRLSFYDDLTQIFNRRSFDAALLKVWNSPVDSHQKTSLMMIDIDNFKLYNDNFGHLQGDKILTRIALTIRTTISSENYTIARYGGEEFVVLMPNTDNQTATETAEMVKEAVAALGLTYFDASVSSSNILSVSIGVATEELATLDASETLIRIADENLYRAKRSGKNSVWSSTNHRPHS